MKIRALAGFLLLATVSMTGCVTLPREPALPFPVPPRIHLACPESEEDPCTIPQADADQLVRWVQKLSEFWKARERILNPAAANEKEP